VIKKNMRPGLLTTFPWLVADIGGSNARFGLVLNAESGVQQIKTIPGRDHVHLNDAVHAYLQQAAQALGAAYQAPRMAAFAVATPITDDLIAFTNSPWSFSKSAIQVEFALESFLVLNDFEALALSLPKLNATQIRAHDQLPVAKGTLAVIGPGTGLGVGGVIETAAGWIAIPGEAGHTTLAAGNDFESAVLTHVRKQYAHVSAERLLSGIGLPVLHQAISHVMQQCKDQTGQSPCDQLSAESILQQGLHHADAVCSKTIDVFCDMLGGFAGNVALTLGARGGVYIGGGIVPRLGERFFTSNFRQRFADKGRFHTYLENIPTALITDTMAALTGAALAIEQYES
jgi:glucokinase